MIHGNSTHPVLIKKINLRLWTLRDEIEAIILDRVNEEGRDQVDLSDLVQEYKTKELKTEKPLTVIDGEKVEEDGDEMLQAMKQAQEEGEVGEENADSQEDEKGGDEQDQDRQEEIQENVQVLRRKPNIPKDKIFSGKMVLSEIDMEHMYFFCEKNFPAGQSIVIDFNIPMRFVLNADILYSRPYNMKSRIISANRLSYRVAVKFTFLKEGERTLLRNFISTIEPEIEEIMAPPPKMLKGGGDSDDDGDDFDELDDLDL